MSYRDHIEAQKKYIRTKKEAKEAKDDRKQNPRPPRLDPPPSPTSPWLIAAVATLMLLPFITLFFFIVPSSVPTDAQTRGLTVWVHSTEAEFDQIKNWLEPEILANDLQWTTAYGTSRQDLINTIQGNTADLMVIEEGVAKELFENQALAPLWDKLEGMTWENSFDPLWQPRPFRKTLGWVITKNGRVEEARHLFTVMRHFALPLSPE